MSLTGYVDPSAHVDEMAGHSHTQNSLAGRASTMIPTEPRFPDNTGPENSLTVWGDQANPEILTTTGSPTTSCSTAEPGFEQAFFTAWHHTGPTALPGMNGRFAAVGSSETFAALLQRLAVSALADGYIDNGATVTGATAADLQNDATEATIFFNAAGERDPGAPP